MQQSSTNAFQADILIVDDTIDNIRVLSALLSEQGYNVRKALNGRMAFTAIQTVAPDLILLDVNMPEINGYEICEQLKANEQTRSIPVIFLSALNDVIDKVKAFQVGGIDYITKPFQLEEVLIRIKTQLELRNLQEQLQTQNRELQQALEHLKQTQLQLIQKEKISGLAQLVAGIAHEINNPVSFIYGNITYAQQYIENLLRLVDLYQQEYPTPSPAIQTAIEEVDLEFLATDLPKLLGSMQSGVARIQSVLLALRLFSRLGESEFKPADLHQGLDCTLQLLQYRMKQLEGKEIRIIKDYGELPLVSCYANQINQVFLNLLDNAIDSLQLRSTQNTFQGEQPTIWIRTEAPSPEQVRVRIQDNGVGISDDLKSCIFDPFFTTKPVGRGFGLGLSMSYQVIEKHRGDLTCTSAPQQGAEFVITLPISRPASR